MTVEVASSAAPTARAPVIDWSGVDHVLLDMDGTILDLAFDNHFWREVVPDRYARLHGLSLADAHATLQPRFNAMMGRLQWYCLDYWSEVTGLDIAGIKAEARARIAALPGSADFLHAVQRSGRPLWLVTNAHHGSWRLKMAETGLHVHFDKILSSHDFGAPKEDPAFWPALRAAHPFDPARALFVDDSLPVLRAARNYGIREVVAIGHPDSSQPPRVVAEFTSVARLPELLPIT